MNSQRVFFIVLFIVAIAASFVIVPRFLHEKQEESLSEFEVNLQVCSGTLTIVFDNNPYDPELGTEWGFSCLVKFGDVTILFDTGLDGRLLLDNMAYLDIDPDEIDFVVLSHIHGDHTNGLDSILRVNSDVKVFLPRSFPSSFKGNVTITGAEVVEVVKATIVY